MTHDVTQLLAAIDAGDDRAAEDLLPLVYRELRRLAARRLAHEEPGHTLQPTALVHEAYLRLVRPSANAEWESRGHFFAAAAEAMRRILVESARRKQRLRHGGDRQRVELRDSDFAISPALHSLDLIALREALAEGAQEDPRKVELVNLRFFAGLSEQEASEILGVSRPTAARWWAYARAWLFDRIAGRENPDKSEPPQTAELAENPQKP